jgi:predicted metal-dependent hydrolase
MADASGSDVPDYELPAAFWQGINAFNAGEFYDCHDILEALWMEAGEPERSFYQGILQIAVACYHYGNRNFRGAMILFGEGMKRLRAYPPQSYGLDLADLLQQGQSCLAQLQAQSLVDGGLPIPIAPVTLPKITLL